MILMDGWMAGARRFLGDLDLETLCYPDGDCDDDALHQACSAKTDYEFCKEGMRSQRSRAQFSWCKDGDAGGEASTAEKAVSGRKKLELLYGLVSVCARAN